jgi:DNA-binding transcriptional MerR regulator
MTSAFPAVYSAGLGAIGRAMPTEIAKKGKWETWRDWQPEGTPDPDELLTRDEFIERARNLHLDIEARDILFWQQRGVLPYGVKKHLDGVNRVVYPRWMLMTISLLRALQSFGFPLSEITARLKTTATQAVQTAKDLDRQDAQQPTWTPLHYRNRDGFLKESAQWLAEEALVDSIGADIAELAQRYAVATGKRVDRIQLSFHQKRGDGTDSELFHRDFPIPKYS